MYLIFSSLLYTQCIHDFNNNDFFPLVIEAMKIVQNSVCMHEITITNLANFITSLRSGRSLVRPSLPVAVIMRTYCEEVTWYKQSTIARDDHYLLMV